MTKKLQQNESWRKGYAAGLKEGYDLGFEKAIERIVNRINHYEKKEVDWEDMYEGIKKEIDNLK